MSNSDHNELETLFDEARTTHTPHFLTPDVGGPTFLLHPEGMKATDVSNAVEAAQPRPDRIRGTVTLNRMASAIAYVLEFKRQGTAGYCFNTTNGGVTLDVVFDHHVGNSNKTAIECDQHDDGARWCGHVARYPFPVSPELAPGRPFAART